MISRTVIIDPSPTRDNNGRSRACRCGWHDGGFRKLPEATFTAYERLPGSRRGFGQVAMMGSRALPTSAPAENPYPIPTPILCAFGPLGEHVLVNGSDVPQAHRWGVNFQVRPRVASRYSAASALGPLSGTILNARL